MGTSKSGAGSPYLPPEMIRQYNQYQNATRQSPRYGEPVLPRRGGAVGGLAAQSGSSNPTAYGVALSAQPQGGNMPILPNGQMMPYNMGQGGTLQARFSQENRIPPMYGQTQQAPQMDPRFEMWRRQQMQRRQAGNMPRFTQPMTMQDRMGMMGPGLASIRAGAQQGPMRQGTAPGVSGMMAAPAGGINMNDLVQRRGILPIG